MNTNREVSVLYKIFLDYILSRFNDSYKNSIPFNGSIKHHFKSFGVYIKYMINFHKLLTQQEYYILWEFVEEKHGYGCNIIEILHKENLVSNETVNSIN